MITRVYPGVKGVASENGTQPLRKKPAPSDGDEFRRMTMSWGFRTMKHIRFANRE